MSMNAPAEPNHSLSGRTSLLIYREAPHRSSLRDSMFAEAISGPRYRHSTHFFRWEDHISHSKYVHWYVLLSKVLGFNQPMIWRAFLLLYFTFSAFVCVIVRHGINQIIQADIYLVPVFSLWSAFFMPPMNIDFEIATSLPKDKIVNWAFSSFMGPLVLNIIQVGCFAYFQNEEGWTSFGEMQEDNILGITKPVFIVIYGTFWILAVPVVCFHVFSFTFICEVHASELVHLMNNFDSAAFAELVDLVALVRENVRSSSANFRIFLISLAFCSTSSFLLHMYILFHKVGGVVQIECWWTLVRTSFWLVLFFLCCISAGRVTQKWKELSIQLKRQCAYVWDDPVKSKKFSSLVSYIDSTSSGYVVYGVRIDFERVTKSVFILFYAMFLLFNAHSINS